MNEICALTVKSFPADSKSTIQKINTNIEEAKELVNIMYNMANWTRIQVNLESLSSWNNLVWRFGMHLLDKYRVYGIGTIVI